MGREIARAFRQMPVRATTPLPPDVIGTQGCFGADGTQSRLEALRDVRTRAGRRVGNQPAGTPPVVREYCRAATVLARISSSERREMSAQIIFIICAETAVKCHCYFGRLDFRPVVEGVEGSAFFTCWPGFGMYCAATLIEDSSPPGIR